MAPRETREDSCSVAEHLTAEGRAGLWPLLERLWGWELPGGWVLDGPLGLGGQGLVVAARGPVGPVAVKLPLVDYHRPWAFGIEDLETACSRLEREATTLEALAPHLKLLPKFHALVRVANPLHSKAGPGRELGKDPFLVMERIHGIPLRCGLVAASSSERVERLRSVVGTLLQALCALADLDGAYTDMKPEHLVLSRTGLRLLDAGGIWLPGHPGLPLTMAYSGIAEGADAATLVSRRSLAESLYEVWTGRRPSTRMANPAEWQAAPEWLRTLVSALEATRQGWDELVQIVG